jgi:predicted nucleic acid-binding protein
MSILVDTSVWSLALRRRRRHLTSSEHAVVAELADLTREGRVRIIGLIRQELLSGIKSPAQYEKLRVALRAFPDEPVATSDHEGAAKASNAFRSKGIATSVVDALICEIARAREWSVFTTDPDFKNYARVLPLKLHTPRPSGGEDQLQGGAEE